MRLLVCLGLFSFRDILGDDFNMLIGVFTEKNVLQTISNERVQSYLDAAAQGNHQLFFFEERSIKLKSKKISGMAFEENMWIQKDFKFPKYVINESALSISRLPSKIKELRKNIAFNTYGIDGYPRLLDRMKQSEILNDFLPNYCKLEDVKELSNLLTNHPSVLVKNNHGEVIYILKNVDEHQIEINDFESVEVVPKSNLFLSMQKALGKEHQFIAMPNYMEMNPLKVHTHIILNKQNEFEVLSKEAFYNEEVVSLDDHLLAHNLNPKYMNFLLDNLMNDLAMEIQTLYKQPRREFSFEFVLEDQKFLLFNSSSIHEDVKDEEVRSAIIFDMINDYEFEQLTSKQISMGMLVGTIKNSGRFRKYNNMRFACTGVAKVKGHNFFFFRPEDIDFKNKIIYGFYYNKEGGYSRKKYRYPDVIIDRLRRRGLEEFQHVYDEFEGIPFNNVRDGGSLDKSYIYKVVSESTEFKNFLIPYMDIVTTDEIMDFVNAHSKIILKPTVASFGDGIVSIFQKGEDDYLVRPGNIEKYEMNTEELRAFLDNYLIECEGVVVQKFIESKTKEGAPFDIRIHLLKNAKAEWNIANIYPRLGGVGGVTSNLSGGGSTTSWLQFFQNQFEDFDYVVANDGIRDFSIQFADFFQDALQAPLNEIAIDIGIDRETMQIYLFEANVNKPGCRNHVLEAAFYMVDYAEHLAKKGMVERQKRKVNL